jgi:UTP--glucose-1-phosphate uridylyltransferase
LSQGERRYDIGNFETYFRAFAEFALADEKFGASFREYLQNILK